MLKTQKHPFHIVDPSPWPFFTACSAFFFLFGMAMGFHNYDWGYLLAVLGLFTLIFYVSLWWRDVIREATFEGDHTEYVRNNIRMGMVLFIVSEIGLFFAFFWAFFHSSLNPVLEIGCVWPSKGLVVINPFHLPILNTIVLLTSSAFVTWAHYSVMAGNHKEAITGLIWTIALAVFFTFLQGYEYLNASFGISDGIYGSTFFMTTGLHGFHVIIGTIFLIVSLKRLSEHHFTRKHHVGLECAIWYWHFVDVVWLFVFTFIYWWGYAAIR